MREIVHGITIWSVFSERMGLDFNGYAIGISSGAILVDPPDPGAEGWDALAQLSPNAVYLTNRNHSRAATAFRDRFSVPVRVHDDDRDELLRSARKLSQRDLDALLLCDGEPVMSGGKERLAEFVSAAGLG